MSTITAPPPPRSAPPAAGHDSSSTLGRYVERDTGARREIIRVPACGGSTLVIDRLAGTHCDPRLVAHLPADEPYENAGIVGSLYLADEQKGHCRPVNAQDLKLIPDTGFAVLTPTEPRADIAFIHADGVLYRVREIPRDGGCSEVRWTRSQDPIGQESFEAVSLREVIATVEDYEPARSLTTRTLASHDGEDDHPVRRLRAELERLHKSPIVLNRRLREIIASKVSHGEMTMSQIALRCGHAKRDGYGNVSGETSWLARRVGLQTESGETKPSPWIHSDVLALIARDGLGIAPHEVEL